MDKEETFVSLTVIAMCAVVIGFGTFGFTKCDSNRWDHELKLKCIETESQSRFCEGVDE